MLLGFPGGSEWNESICNAGDLGLIPGFWRSPGSEDPMEKGMAFLPGESHGQRSLVGVHGVAKSQTQLSDLANK